MLRRKYIEIFGARYGSEEDVLKQYDAWRYGKLVHVIRNKRINSLVYRIIKLPLAYAREFVRCNVASHPASKLVNTQYRFYLSVTFIILMPLRFTLISAVLISQWLIIH